MLSVSLAVWFLPLLDITASASTEFKLNMLASLPQCTFGALTLTKHE